MCNVATSTHDSLPHSLNGQLCWPIGYFKLLLRNHNTTFGTNGRDWGRDSVGPVWCIRARVRPRVCNTSTGDGHMTLHDGRSLDTVVRGRADSGGVRLPMWHNYNNFEPMVGEVCDFIQLHSVVKPNIASNSCIHGHRNTRLDLMYNEEGGR